MILKKEFYFVRHGQTDHNISEGREKADHPVDIPLNQTGREQALLIEPIIATLPVQEIYTSPLKRVQETKEIIAARLHVPHYLVEDLSECSAAVWKEMRSLGMYYPVPEKGIARDFMNRVQRGINEALASSGPSLIVAHGGIHWAACCLMNIQTHSWIAQNCAVVHFFMEEGGQWAAKEVC